MSEATAATPEVTKADLGIEKTEFEKQFGAFKKAKQDARDQQRVVDRLKKEIDDKKKELREAEEEFARRRKRVATLTTTLPELLSKEMVGA